MEQGKSLQVIGQGSAPAFVEAQMQSLEGAMQYANALLKSKMCPAHFYEKKKESGNNGYEKWVPDYDRGKPEAVLMVLQHGREIGLSYMQSLQQIVPVNGLVAIKGDGAKSLIMGKGKCSSWKETFFGTPFQDDYGCEITATRPDTGETKTIRFTVADARRAGLWVTEEMVGRTPALKYGGWYKYPNRMVRYRALGFLARDLFPDVLLGTAIQEEVEDFEVDNTIVKTEDGMTVDHNKIARADAVTEVAKNKNKKGQPEKTVPFNAAPPEIKSEDSVSEPLITDAQVVDDAPKQEESPVTAGMMQLKGPELIERVNQHWPVASFDPWSVFNTTDNIRKPSNVRGMLLAIADGTIVAHMKEKYGADLTSAPAEKQPAAEPKTESAAPKKSVALPDFITEPGESGRDMRAAVAVADFLTGKIDEDKILDMYSDSFSDIDDFYVNASLEMIQTALS